MIRFGRKKSLAIVTILLSAAAVLIPDRAGCDTCRSTGGTADRYLAGAETKETQKEQKGQRGLRRHALSFIDYGGGVQAGTSVLLKPLRTDQFYVAFAAGASRIKNDQTSSALPYGAHRSETRQSDSQRPAQEVRHNPMAGWMVLTDLLGSDTPLPVIPSINPIVASKVVGHDHWFSKLELIFLPTDQWMVRAILSLDQDTSSLLPSFSSLMNQAPRMGMAIHVDYQIVKRLALGLDYGHYTYGRLSIPAKADVQPSNTIRGAGDQLDEQVVGAHLTIHF